MRDDDARTARYKANLNKPVEWKDIRHVIESIVVGTTCQSCSAMTSPTVQTESRGSCRERIMQRVLEKKKASLKEGQRCEKSKNSVEVSHGSVGQGNSKLEDAVAGFDFPSVSTIILAFLPYTSKAATALVQYACLASVTVVCTHPVTQPSHPANDPVCNCALTPALHCELRNHAAAANEY